MENVLEYVEDVIEGSKKKENDVGRDIIDMVKSVKKMKKEEFENMLNYNIKDMLMVIKL
jgi:translation initiation factor 3 subunit F